jgi:hypothetical protein
MPAQLHCDRDSKGISTPSLTRQFARTNICIEHLRPSVRFQGFASIATCARLCRDALFSAGNRLFEREFILELFRECFGVGGQVRIRGLKANFHYSLLFRVYVLLNVVRQCLAPAITTHGNEKLGKARAGPGAVFSSSFSATHCMDSQCPTPEHAPAASPARVELPALPLQLDTVQLAAPTLPPPADLSPFDTFFRLEIEWPDSDPRKLPPNILPLKKKRSQTHATPQVFRPFTLFGETELTVKSLRSMTQGMTGCRAPNSFVGEHNASG